MSTKRTIAVIGATGAQGGSVVKKYLEKPDWKIRAITRNVGGDKAKALAAQGVELVAGNLDDEDSLVKAFEGVDVIFGVTNWWETFATNGFDAHAAGKREFEQAINIAKAAAKIPTLTHYVWSTLEAVPSIFVPHIDYKARSNGWIKENLKDLFSKTTFLMVGYYPVNIEYIPMLKPLPTSPYSPAIQLFSVPPSTMTPSAGDVTVNVGTFVSAIVEKSELTTPGKAVSLQTDWISLEDHLKLWSEITGKPSVAVQVDPETYVKIWGPFGTELDLNMRAFTKMADGGYHSIPDRLTGESLGIEGELHNTKKALETLYAQLAAA